MDNLIDLEQALHQRFGVQALRPLADIASTAEHDIISTGFSELDV